MKAMNLENQQRICWFHLLNDLPMLLVDSTHETGTTLKVCKANRFKSNLSMKNLHLIALLNPFQWKEWKVATYSQLFIAYHRWLWRYVDSISHHFSQIIMPRFIHEFYSSLLSMLSKFMTNVPKSRLPLHFSRCLFIIFSYSIGVRHPLMWRVKQGLKKIDFNN